MKKNNKSAEGHELKDDASNYDKNAYESPSVTTDIVLLSIIDNELGVLLIKRKYPPFRDHWALPGGFVDIDEDIESCALRELKEEAGITNCYLEQLYTFGSVNRDPRKRIISVAYYALIDYKKVKAVAGSDAEKVQWFKMSELPKLAFDHGEVIDKAIERIRNKIYYTNVGFELVPDSFTIPELRRAFESVLGEKINPTNFRTKILKLKILKPTKEKRIEGKGQPAPVYKLDKERLKKLKKGETIFN